MAVKLKSKKQTMTVGSDKGKQKYVTRTITYSCVKEDTVIAYAANSAHIPQAAVIQAAKAIQDAIVYFVVNGHNVQLKKFANFGIKINAKTVENVEDVKPSLITRRSIRFMPSPELKRVIRNTQVEIKDIKE